MHDFRKPSPFKPNILLDPQWELLWPLTTSPWHSSIETFQEGISVNRRAVRHLYDNIQACGKPQFSGGLTQEHLGIKFPSCWSCWVVKSWVALKWGRKSENEQLRFFVGEFFFHEIFRYPLKIDSGSMGKPWSLGWRFSLFLRFLLGKCFGLEDLQVEDIFRWVEWKVWRS